MLYLKIPALRDAIYRPLLSSMITLIKQLKQSLESKVIEVCSLLGR